MNEKFRAETQIFIEQQVDTTKIILLGEPHLATNRLRDENTPALSARWTVPLWYGGTDPETHEDSDLHQIKVEYHLSLNRRRDRMAVQHSKYSINVGEAPALRYEYERGNTNAPMSHIHVHGVGGLLSPGLMRNGKHGRKRINKGDWQALHLPAEGARYRPSLGEFL